MKMSKGFWEDLASKTNDAAYNYDCSVELRKITKGGAAAVFVQTMEDFGYENVWEIDAVDEYKGSVILYMNESHLFASGLNVFRCMYL